MKSNPKNPQKIFKNPPSTCITKKSPTKHQKIPTITTNQQQKPKNHKLSDQITQRKKKKKKKKKKKTWKYTPLASPTSSHDPPGSGAVVDHGSLSESLHFFLSSSLGLPFHLPVSVKKMVKKKRKKERSLYKGKRRRMKKK
jgi:hypothetical protein